MRVKKLMQGIQGDIAGAMRRWEPVRFTQAKDCSNNKIWESFEKDGLKTKSLKNGKIVSEKKNKEELDNNALMLEDIADPFGDLKEKLDILG